MRTRSLMSSREEANPEGSGLQSRFSVLFVFSDNPAPPPTNTRLLQNTEVAGLRGGRRGWDAGIHDGGEHAGRGNPRSQGPSRALDPDPPRAWGSLRRPATGGVASLRSPEPGGGSGQLARVWVPRWRSGRHRDSHSARWRWRGEGGRGPWFAAASRRKRRPPPPTPDFVLSLPCTPRGRGADGYRDAPSGTSPS